MKYEFLCHLGYLWIFVSKHAQNIHILASGEYFYADSPVTMNLALKATPEI